MSVPGISPTIISNAFLTNPVSGVDALRGSSRGLSSDDVFLIGLLMFLTQLHNSMMSAWDSFQENQSEVHERGQSGVSSRQTRNQDVRIQQNEVTRLEGQRRQVESRKVETEGDVPTHAGRPHTAKRRFHDGARIYEGEYTDPSTRQLNLPV